jgi:ferrous iron transport protein A
MKRAEMERHSGEQGMRKKGKTEDETMMPLGLLGPGEQGEITALKARKPPCCGGCAGEDIRIEELGLRIGKIVEMLNNGGGGPVLLKVDESRIAVDRSMAMKIMVKEVRQ